MLLQLLLRRRQLVLLQTVATDFGQLPAFEEAVVALLRLRSLRKNEISFVLENLGSML
jgi:hypothetical protein